MAKRAPFALLFCMMIVGFGSIGCDGCAGTPPNFNEVVLNPSGTRIVGSGTALPISAKVLNDTSGAGVTWTPPTHGTLSAVTTTSAVYNAPVIAPGASVSDTVTATSITFPTQSKSLAIMVEGAPIVTTMALPAGNYGSPYTATIAATGGVAPYSWSIFAGTLTPGLSLQPSTTNSVMISGTPGAQADSNFTIQITDSTGASSTQPLTISIGAPLPLGVSPAALPNGVLNTPYPATTLQATGGVPPFTWTLTSAASTFPTGLSLASDGAITGTPTATGTFNFTVHVTDSEMPAMGADGDLSITINNLTTLTGNYAFELSGFNAGGAVMVAGSFTADGAGNITAGVEDINTMAGPPANNTFTGTYTLGGDNRGQLIFSSLAGMPTYNFAIDSAGAHGRLIEFDSSGIRGSGELEQRTISTCAFNTITGNYAFGISGQETVFGGNAAGPAVIVGSFLATPPPLAGTAGSIASAEDDSSTPGGITSQDQSLNGTFQTSAQSTRCTMTLSPSLAGASSGLTFGVYPVSVSEAFLVEIDQVSSNPVNPGTASFLTSGKMLTQAAGLAGTAGSTFTATSVAGLTGQVFTGGAYEPDLALVSLTGTGNASYTISILENQAGNVVLSLPANPNFVSADQFGRVNSGILSPVGPIFYVVGLNEAFCIGEGISNNGVPNPFFGLFEPQSTGPFSASGLNGAFVLGTSAPATSAVTDLSGTMTLANTTTTSGTVSGTQDQSSSGGNTAAQALMGSYTGLNLATGSGILTLTAPTAFSGDFVVVSPTKIILMSTTTGDTDPVMIFLGDCQQTCGED
jgi:Putative Ig domain